MIPISTKKATKLTAKERLEKMEQLIKILALESCLQIYSYLIIFGRTTPAMLREVTGQSKATIFRNLALLSDAGILDKEENVAASDKRYSLQYYVKQELMKYTKSLYTKEVHLYAQKNIRQDVIDEWASMIEGLPLVLSHLTNQYIPLTETSSMAEGDCCVAVAKFLTFRVGEVDDLTELIGRITDLVDAFDSHKAKRRRDLKKPLTRPVALSISLTYVSPEEDIRVDGAVTISRRMK